MGKCLGLDRRHIDLIPELPTVSVERSALLIRHASVGIVRMTRIPPDPAAEGETDFASLFGREFQRVVRLLYAMTRSQQLAQDVAQDAFTTLFERWETIENPEGFVRAVAVNRLRDQVRSAEARGRALDRLRPRETSGEMVDYLSDALAELPVKRRAMVVLRYYEQRTVDEIAEILDVRPGTVKSGLSRSLDRLREVLA